MTIEKELLNRSDGKCELCGSTDEMNAYDVPPDSDGSAEKSVLLCIQCREQIENSDKTDVHHWHCLNESMWSEITAVQVLAWRMLKRLSGEGWAQDLLDMLYLDEESLAWAMATGEGENDENTLIHSDSNGVILTAGDTVTLIKDLNVKGGGFTAKRGTPVRDISLVSDNAGHIEGRVSGQQIVILTKFVKKAN